MNLVKCPFCKEDDFDLVGLKNHLERSCEHYNKMPSLYELAVARDMGLKIPGFDFETGEITI